MCTEEEEGRKLSRPTLYSYNFKAALDKYNMKHEDKIPVPTDAKIKRVMEIIDVLTGTLCRSKQFSLEARRRRRDAIVLSMVTQGSYYNLIEELFMNMRPVCSGADADPPD